MQQQKAVAVGTRSVTAVELSDRGARHGEQVGVAVDHLAVRIDAVRQEHEGEVAAAGEVMDLQPFSLLQEVGLVGQQRRHCDERSQRSRNAFRESETGQRHGAEAPGDRTVDKGDRRSGRRKDSDQGEQNEPSRVRPGRKRPQHGGQQDCGDEQDRTDIAANAEADIEAADPQPGRRPEPDRSLERAAALGDQMVAGIAGALRLDRVEGIGRCPVRRIQRVIGNVELRARRATRQLLDRAPVKIACREVHGGERARRAQPCVDEAHALEQLRPVDIGDQPHAGDDVAHRNLEAPCRCWACLTTSSIETPCRPSRSSSQPSVGVVRGSWSRRRFASWAAKSSDSGPDERTEMSVSRADRAPPDARSRSARASASVRAARPAVIWSESRRRFSMRTMRSVIATAHSSPIVRGWTR